MKSLIEEASSVSKAVEKGWVNAGKPKEFTIKVYEEAEKNFIGMTTKQAKIGIFFAQHAQAPVEQKPRKEKERVERAANPAPQKQRAQKPVEVEVKKEVKAPVERVEKKVEKAEDLGPIWSEDMAQSAKEWVGEMLEHMGLGSVPFTVLPQKFHLRIEFSKNILDDLDKQKHLFALTSGLLLTMLKRHYKRPLRGYKVVLTTEQR